MKEITITKDQYLTLDYLQEKLGTKSDITVENNGKSYQESYMATNKKIFDPTETGKYEMKYNDYSLMVNVQDILENFEDGDISEYNGDTGSWSINTNKVYEGNYSAFCGSDGKIYRTDINIKRGQIIEGRIFSDGVNRGSGIILAASGTSSSDVSGYLLGHQNAGSNNSISFGRYDSGSLTRLKNSSTSPPNKEWLKFIFKWYKNGDITYILKDSNDNQVKKFELNDTTYDQGGIGWECNSGNDNNNMWVDNCRITGQV